MSLLIFAVFLTAVHAGTDTWSGLSVRYPYTNSSADKNVLWAFEVPLFIGEEVASGEWIEIKVNNFYNLRATSLKVDYDYGFMPLYDQNGILAGVQICQPYDIISRTDPYYYDPLSQGTVEVLNINDNKFYCSSYLIVSPDTIKAGGRTSISTPIGEGLWLRDTSNMDTGYTQVPDSITELLATTDFVWQNCIPRMGAHFFKGQDLNFDCSKLYNWFLLGDVVNTNSINGLVFQIYGRKTIYNTAYPDDTVRMGSQAAAPYTSQCFYDNVDIYGLLTIHIYFNDNPEDIACQDGDIVPPPCTD